jgi:hypothetical protein
MKEKATLTRSGPQGTRGVWVRNLPPGYHHHCSTPKYKGEFNPRFMKRKSIPHFYCYIYEVYIFLDVDAPSIYVKNKLRNKSKVFSILILQFFLQNTLSISLIEKTQYWYVRRSMMLWEKLSCRRTCAAVVASPGVEMNCAGHLKKEIVLWMGFF